MINIAINGSRKSMIFGTLIAYVQLNKVIPW